ncbi:hypothetical protein GW17_00014193, partial [Ensete ventricosum]
FDGFRVPRENLLNSVADVFPDGRYVSSVENPDQVTSISKLSIFVGLAIAVRYALTRRAFSISADGPEVLLLDYPAYQRRLLPLIAKTFEDIKLVSIVQLDLFRLRERDLLARYADEVSRYQAQGESKEKAALLVDTQGLCIIIIIVFTCVFLQDVLGLLRSMYALICTEEDASFLRYGYLSLDSAAAARKEVMKLCYDLRPHALSVVSSFGIPDAFLSPIAFDWVEANSWSSLNEE